MVILAKAVFKFEGAQSDDLPFDEDDVITVLQKDESGWWTGRNEHGREGDFPFNYVELLDERETQAYLKRREEAGGAVAEMSFNGDNVDTIEVVQAMPAGAGKPAQFVLESSTSTGTREQVTKGLAEIRAFDEQLRTVLPDWESKLPPTWADKAINLPERVLERRKEAMDMYVQKLVTSEGADFLLVPFLFPGRSVELHADSFAAAAKAQEQAKQLATSKKPEGPPILARAEYKWDPQDAVELSLDAGEVLAVISQTTASDGWWEGQTADGARGLFPFNHVEVLSSSDVSAFMEGKAMSPLAEQELSPVEKVKKDHIPKSAERPVKVVPNFTINTLPAFDDIIEKGYASENMSGTGSGSRPKPGDRVQLEFKAHVWDSQALAILEFLSSDDKGEGPLEFVVEDDPNVCQGLHLAIQRFSPGESGRIIIAPRMGYGVAGSPPVIPPLAHLVYDVKLLSNGAQTRSTPKQKPSVKARVADAAPRVLSMRNLAPIGNRTPSKAPSKPDAPVMVNPSVEHQTGARRAGHVMVETNPQGSASVPTFPKQEIPKFGLKELQEIVSSDKVQERGLNRATLEDYLNDQAFFEAFLMDRGHFLLKPLWRQQALKRAVGLF